MTRQALKAATFIIVMLAVATIFVDVVSAQQPISPSEKNTAPAKQDPPIFRPPILRPPILRPPILRPPFFPFPIFNIHIKL
jgi:hypothetical protein